MKELESLLKQNRVPPTETCYKVNVEDVINREVGGEGAFDVRNDSGFRIDVSQDEGTVDFENVDFENAGWLNQTPSDQLRVFSSLAPHVVRLYICIYFILFIFT